MAPYFPTRGSKNFSCMHSQPRHPRYPLHSSMSPDSTRTRQTHRGRGTQIVAGWTPANAAPVVPSTIAQTATTTAMTLLTEGGADSHLLLLRWSRARKGLLGFVRRPPAPTAHPPRLAILAQRGAWPMSQECPGRLGAATLSLSAIGTSRSRSRCGAPPIASWSHRHRRS